jgi:hypothetical protein
MKALLEWPVGRWYRIPLLAVAALILATSLLFIWGIPTVHRSSGGTSWLSSPNLDSVGGNRHLPGGEQG